MGKGILSKAAGTMLCIAFGMVALPAAEYKLQDLDYTDHLAPLLKNPGRGLAPMKGFRVKPGESLNLRTNGTVYNDFMRFHVDLGAFSDNAFVSIKGTDTIFGVSQPIDSFAIASVHAVLDSLRRRGGSCVIRQSYDMNCYGKQEPSTEWILKHAAQMAKAYNGYEDVIHYVEIGMFGTCGEQTSMNGESQEKMAEVLQTFLENTNDEIPVGMRSPYVIAVWLGLKDAYSGGGPAFGDFDIHSARFQDSVQSRQKYFHRVGLYNDGYLGSDNDLGTVGWGHPPLSREKMVQWLESERVPYGGDFVHNYNDSSRPPLNTAEYMSYEGFRTHTSYVGSFGNLDKYYHNMGEVLFKGPDAEYGGKATGYEYIRDHLGYRFVLRSSEILDSIGVGGRFQARVKIQNVGFSNNRMVKKATLLLKNASDSTQIFELPLDIDPTQIHSRKLNVKSENPTSLWNGENLYSLYDETDTFDGINVLEFSASLPETMTQGKWNSFLRFSRYGNFKSDGNFHTIRFANDSTYYDAATGSNFIGSFVLSDKVPAAMHSAETMVKNPAFRVYGKNLELENVSRVEIYDLQGSRILKQSIQGNAILPLQYKSGVYIIRLQNGNFLKKGKIQIQ